MKAFELLRKEMEATGEETKEQTDIVLKENKKALQEWNTYLQEETITVTTTISRYVSNKCRYVVV